MEGINLKNVEIHLKKTIFYVFQSILDVFEWI